MTEEERSELIARIKSHLGEREETGTEEKPKARWQKIKKLVKPLVISAGIAGSLAIGLFTYDFYSKGQNYPERNVLFTTKHETTFYAGGTGKESSTKLDKKTVISFSEGGGIESKVGPFLFETTRASKGDEEDYSMKNPQNMAIAYSKQKSEIFQGGWRAGGSTNFREELAVLVLSPILKAPKKYMVYKLAPERGWSESDVDVVEFPIERGLGENEPGIIETIETEKGKEEKIRLMVNRLVENRTILGWCYGKDPYRKGTLLEDFEATPENKKLAKDFFDEIRILDSEQATKGKTKEDCANKVMEIEEKMKKRTIYSTFESGFLKVLPQGSVIYLGENPGKWERFKNWAGFGRKNHTRLVVDNQWDLWPGNIPVLNKFSIFNRYNNGGYTIKDKFGDIAKIQIDDFIFYYGPRVLYSYFLDLNGDGKLDKEKELIGKVLCKTPNNERIELEKFVKGKKPSADITFTVNSSFMAPSPDKEKGWEYCKLCAYTESMMPDQIHRGFGKHSLLLLLNDQRSDKILFDELSVENESRALTQESTLVAKYDGVRFLIAAKRPYAEQIARHYGIYEEFKGQFQPSSLLRERTELGPLPGIGTGLALLVGGAYFLRRRMRAKKPLDVGERLKELNLQDKSD